MERKQGRLGAFPYVAVGGGAPLVFLGGLSPDVGVHNPATRRSRWLVMDPFTSERRVLYLNRRPGLPRGMAMADLAAEHAQALRGSLPVPVDVIGMSTGGSIAQQLAADHPDVVRRLILVSSACRLGPAGRLLQRRVAARVRAGAHAQALALLICDIAAPGPARPALALLGRLAGPRLFPSTAELDDMATTVEAEDGFDLAACAQPVKSPTLIVAGADDRFYSRELFRETAELIPGSRLTLLEGRGHATVLADPGYRPAILQFLSDG